MTIELPAGAVLKNRVPDLEIATPFMQASRKVAFGANKLTLTANSRMLDARLAPSESTKVYDAFRRLHDHTQSTFTIQMPGQVPAPASQQVQISVVGEGVRPQGPAKQLRLNGISGAAPNRLAIINGKTMAAGESASVRLDNRQLRVRCVAINDTCAFVNVEGVDGTTRLDLSN